MYIIFGLHRNIKSTDNIDPNFPLFNCVWFVLSLSVAESHGMIPYVLWLHFPHTIPRLRMGQKCPHKPRNSLIFPFHTLVLRRPVEIKHDNRPPGWLCLPQDFRFRYNTSTLIYYSTKIVETKQNPRLTPAPAKVTLVINADSVGQRNPIAQTTFKGGWDMLQLVLCTAVGKWLNCGVIIPRTAMGKSV